MKASPSICILIAAYNEAPIIGHVIADCHAHGYSNILVVDDGSSDETAGVAKRAGATVISLPLNCGKSAAVSTGLEYLASHVIPPGVAYGQSPANLSRLREAGIPTQAPEIVVLMDADGQHLAKEISLLVAPIQDSPHVDVVCGVRKLNQSTPLINKVGRFVGDLTTWLHTRRFFSDSQCGFRALRLQSFGGFGDGNGKYAIETHLLDFAVKNQLGIVPVPIRNVYTHYSTHKPHKQGLIRGIETLVSLLK